MIGIPTHTEDFLGTNDWTLGPTFVFLFAGKGHSAGALLSQSWSVGGDDDINSLLFQPFYSYTTPKAVTYAINTESVYDWNTDDYVAPINLSVQKLVTKGKSRTAYQFGLKYYASDTPASPKGWGLRFQITKLFPK